MLNTMSPEAVRLRLHELMRERGLTQTELAKMSGISRVAIGNLVRDPRAISLSTIQALCDALGVTPAELFEYNESPEMSQRSH